MTVTDQATGTSFREPCEVRRAVRGPRPAGPPRRRRRRSRHSPPQPPQERARRRQRRGDAPIVDAPLRGCRRRRARTRTACSAATTHRPPCRVALSPRALREQSGLGVGVEGLHALEVPERLHELDEVPGRLPAGRAAPAPPRSRRAPCRPPTPRRRRRAPLLEVEGLGRARPRRASARRRRVVFAFTCALSRFREDGGASGWRKWCCAAKRCSRRPHL